MKTGDAPSPSGAFRLTEADIAQRLGISRATVSRALHGKGRVSDATRSRVISAADRLGFVPNVMASELAAGRSETIGLLIRDSTNPAYGQLFDALQSEAAIAGMQLVTVTATHSGSGPGQLSGLRRLLGMRVAGLIVAAGDVSAAQLGPFRGTVPMIRAGRPETAPEMNAVSYDEDHHGAVIAEHIFELGHRRVVVIEPRPGISHPEWVRATAIGRRFEALGGLAHRVPVAGVSEGVDEALDAVAAGAATAVLCPTDLRQLEVLRVAASRGMRCPDSFSVTGCDGLLHGGDLLGLTTVRLPVEELASRTIATMGALLTAAGDRAVTHDVIRGALVRGSTAGPPPGALR